MTRNEKLKKIYSRLASLEEQREELRLQDKDTSDVDKEMTATRQTLEKTMNEVDCPLVNGIYS